MKSYRNTIQQQLVLDSVRELNIHANAEQVYEYAVKKHPSISKSTVYRQLNRLVESGGIACIGEFYGNTHYDHQCHKHYHFICEECRRIFDVDDCFPELQVKTLDGFEIRNCNLSFGGLCRDCVGRSVFT